MKKALQIIGILLVIALPAGMFGVYALWNKEHRDVGKEQPAYKLTTAELLTAFQENEEEANAKYIDKTVLITGEFLESEGDEDRITYILNGAACTMTNKPDKSPQPGEEVKIKGRVTSYDDLFGDIRLADCSLEN